MKRFNWQAVGIILGLLLLLGVVTHSGSPKLGCCTQAKIMYSGTMRAIHILGPDAKATQHLEAAMRDAYGPCVWEGKVFRCQGE